MPSFSEVLSCETLSEFESQLPSAFESKRFLYRGQADSEWGLVPSLFRYLSPIGRAWSFDEDALLAAFQKEARLHHSSVEVSSIERLALAQHFGVPTRLLDWTSSPHVALWFALNETDRRLLQESDVAVWVLDRSAEEVSEVDNGFANLPSFLPWVVSVHVFEPPRFDGRIAAQDSHFTIHHCPPDGAAFSPVEQTIDIKKLIVPKSRTTEMLAAVERNGIHAARLFPDLSGAARRAREQVTSLTKVPWGVIRQEVLGILNGLREEWCQPLLPFRGRQGVA